MYSDTGLGPDPSVTLGKVPVEHKGPTGFRASERKGHENQKGSSDKGKKALKRYQEVTLGPVSTDTEQALTGPQSGSDSLGPRLVTLPFVDNGRKGPDPQHLSKGWHRYLSIHA